MPPLDTATDETTSGGMYVRRDGVLINAEGEVINDVAAVEAETPDTKPELSPELPFSDYDSLSVTAILKRVQDEPASMNLRDAVLTYERKNRGRRTLIRALEGDS